MGELKKQDLTDHSSIYDKSRMEEMTLGEVRGLVGDTRNGFSSPKPENVTRSLSQSWSDVSRDYSDLYTEIGETKKDVDMVSWGGGQTWGDAADIQWGAYSYRSELSQGWENVSR